MITEYKTYLNPLKVYIPLTDLDYKIANVSVQVGDKVLVGQLLAFKFKGKEKSPVLSTVSGLIEGFVNLTDRYGKIVDHIIIENDKKYTHVETTSYQNKVSAAEVRNVINNMGLSKISIDGLFTDLEFNTKSKYVIVNGVFINEPFISIDYDFLTNHCESIADGIALLGTAANAEKMIILVDKFLPEENLNILGTAVVDKNIEVISIDAKRIRALDYKIIKRLVKETLNINLIENGVVYTDIQAVRMVHEAVRKGLNPTISQVALTGDGLKVNVMYDVRIGTKFSDLVEDVGGYTDTANMTLHIGSFLTGVELDNDDFVITQTVNSINVAEYRSVEEDVCIKCGDCNDICPAGILPQNIMDAELRSVNSRIIELNTNECVECGLCSYACPSKINVLEWVRRAKRRVG